MPDKTYALEDLPLKALGKKVRVNYIGLDQNNSVVIGTLVQISAEAVSEHATFDGIGVRYTAETSLTLAHGYDDHITTLENPPANTQVTVLGENDGTV